MDFMFPNITDVHLSLSGGASVIFPGPVPATSEHDALIDELKANVQSSLVSKIIVLRCGDRWRVTEMRPGRYALRRMRKNCPKLEELHLPQWIQACLVRARIAPNGGGLVMILGPTGGGKTTTFSAVISRRLALHGGYALTIEDPPEDKLEGFHGNGFCEQLDANMLGGYEQAMHTALRSFPAKENSILGYGEVRENATAAHLLRVALDGHLVIFTFHAKSISSGVGRIISMAEAGGELNASELFLSSFSLGIHQRFNEKRELIVNAMVPEMCPPVRAFIKSRNFDSIESEVSMLNSKMSGK